MQNGLNGAVAMEVQEGIRLRVATRAATRAPQGAGRRATRRLAHALRRRTGGLAGVPGDRVGRIQARG